MKKRILMVATVLVVLGMAIAAVAYQRASVSGNHAAMSCCCKGDSCPMKAQNAAAGHTATECCEDPRCCCKGEGDACPMKKGEGAHTVGAEMKHTAMDGKTECCSCPCCKKDSEA